MFNRWASETNLRAGLSCVHGKHIADKFMYNIFHHTITFSTTFHPVNFIAWYWHIRNAITHELHNQLLKSMLGIVVMTHKWNILEQTVPQGM